MNLLKGCGWCGVLIKNIHLIDVFIPIYENIMVNARQTLKIQKKKYFFCPKRIDRKHLRNSRKGFTFQILYEKNANREMKLSKYSLNTRQMVED